MDIPFTLIILGVSLGMTILGAAYHDQLTFALGFVGTVSAAYYLHRNL